ncbi:MAG: aminotransferase class V-fold PLP-dependent enzyme [Pirellulales bacterium]
MAASKRIYLDNAATSWPKPDAVYEAIDRYMRVSGAPAGRSVYAEAHQANQAVAAARASVARFIGADDPRRIIFTLNGTEALNIAIHGLLDEGDHVVTTVAEHNSVLRPLRELESTRGVRVDRVTCNARGYVDPDGVRAALGAKTKLVVLTHASNVTGTIQPVADIARIAHERGALVLVDAAQTLGYLPVHVGELGVDLLAAPGHKGLLGPLGTGLLYLRAGVENKLRSLTQGGTGTQSDQDRHPQAMPYKYEAGSSNVPGIVGLSAGIDFLRLQGNKLRILHQQLTERLVAGLIDIQGVKVFGPADPTDRVGVVSITIDGYDPQEVAAMLDGAHRVQVRAGFHCAPLMHAAVGTIDLGGAVRFSVGVFNTEADIDAAVAAVAEVAAESATA